jgi:formiminotetrahydrofolate cyclodeaminase
MNTMNGPVKKYLKDLAARSPAPGGGSATAIAGAMAAGLVAMAASFTLGKIKYKSVAPRMKKILSRATALRRRLEVLCDKDIRAYRSKDLQAAVDVPAEVARVSYEVALLAQEVLYEGNSHLVTDVVLAVMMAEASFAASVFYIQANMSHAIAATPRNKKMLSALKKCLPELKKMRKNAEDHVGTSFGW